MLEKSTLEPEGKLKVKIEKDKEAFTALCRLLMQTIGHILKAKIEFSNNFYHPNALFHCADWTSVSKDASEKAKKEMRPINTTVTRETTTTVSRL